MKKENKFYMSKSRMGTYISCPYAYKFSYIDRIKGGNIYTEIGNEVHDFIDEFFDIVKPNPITEKLDNIGKLNLTPNLDYKKNVLLFEANRWKNICRLPITNEMKIMSFKPIHKENKYRDEKNMLVGIVDRVHKVYSVDNFAPPHSEFKDGDMVIVENKTGAYTKQKSIKYEEELLWYRMLIKENFGNDIRWGCIYYPKTNKTYFIDLNEPKFDIDRLLKQINRVRDCINKEMFIPTPGKNCANCFYLERCEFSKNG